MEKLDLLSGELSVGGHIYIYDIAWGHKMTSRYNPKPAHWQIVFMAAIELLGVLNV